MKIITELKTLDFLDFLILNSNSKKTKQFIPSSLFVFWLFLLYVITIIIIIFYIWFLKKNGK